MLTLSIDTSAGTSVALHHTSDDPRVSGVVTTPEPLAVTVSDNPRAHAEVLSPLIAHCLRTAGKRIEDVGLVVVGTGPAPFTGLRVGLVTGRTIGRARGVEVVGVPSLDAWARGAFDAWGGAVGGADPADGEGGCEVVVATDARRREVYAARYSAAGPDDVCLLAGPLVCTAATALGVLSVGVSLETGAASILPATNATSVGPGAPAITGPGTALYPDDLPATSGLPERLSLFALVRVAHARLARRAVAGKGAVVPELGTAPLYLRRPDVHDGGRSRP